MPIIRLAWTDPEAAEQCTRTFIAAEFQPVLLAVAKSAPGTPGEVWVDDKLRAKLNRVLAEENW